MKIEITYRYTRELSDKIYVERAERITERAFELADKDLSPAAREAALSALCGGNQWDRQPVLFAVPDGSAVHTAQSRGDSKTAPATLDGGTLDREPTETEARADVERLLVRAAQAAPGILAELARRKALVEERYAVELRSAIDLYLSLPLDKWLEGQTGNRRVNNYDWARSRMLPASTNELRTLDPRLEARYQEALAEADRQNREHVAQLERNRAQERLLLVEHGTQDQVERFDERLLPKEEFNALIHSVLFASLSDLPRYVAMVDSDVEHDDGCDNEDSRFGSSEHTGPLDADEFARLKEIREKAPKGAEIVVREHVGTCRGCEARAVRLGVRVTIEWAGNEYAQEYAID